MTRDCNICGGVFCLNDLVADKKSKYGRMRRCKKCQNKLIRDNHRQWRLEVLEYYGGKPPTCFCCGESTYEFLSVDHINGGGNKHRQELMAGSRGTVRWLKREGFPDGYRVLCHNCNLSYGFYGYCPHGGS
jgi:hypothetical protein